MTTNIIFEDLEIDFSDNMSNPRAFSKRVYAKADELRSILKSDTTYENMLSKIEANKEFADKEIIEEIDDIYTHADELPIEQMADIIDRVSDLLASLKTAYKDRIIREAANNSTDIADKRLAHFQYSRLRDSWNFYCKAMAVLKMNNDFGLRPLPAMPGNYGSGGTTFVHHVFSFSDDEQYRNHAVVAKKLGIQPTSENGIITLMDVIEYIAANPDCGVSHREVR